MDFEYAVALTGGIATGKSSVSTIFKAEGFVVIDADKIAHTVLNQASTEVANLFGREVLCDNGINRKVLGSIVFANQQKRKALEALLHPLIYHEILKQSRVEEVKRKPYLIDIPLFFESNRYQISRTIVVYASRTQQIERGMHRDGFSKEEILRRLNAQIEIEKKRQWATYLIDNSGEQNILYEKTIEVINQIKKDVV